MRSSGGPTQLIVYCGDYRCAHSVVVNADHWGDDVRLSDLRPSSPVGLCGHRGAWLQAAVRASEDGDWLINEPDRPQILAIAIAWKVCRQRNGPGGQGSAGTVSSR